MKAIPLRKTLKIELAGETHYVDVTFRLIEIVETVFDCGAEMVIAAKLIDRQQAYESAIVASAEAFGGYAGLIRLAVGYALSYVTEEALDAFANGTALPEVASSDEKKPTDEPS
jgi:hypothetical protein